MSLSSMHPLSIQTDHRLELTQFSTAFQQWDLTSDSAPVSRRGSVQYDSDYSSSSPISGSNPDFDVLGVPHKSQRAAQACDKCRERKTKCSGDHPVCKRCTARGLICHYSGGPARTRGSTKARLRNAMSSSSLDVRFGRGSDGDAGMVKQEDPIPSAMYAMECSAQSQPEHRQFSFPAQHAPLPWSQPSQAPSPGARDSLQLSRMPRSSHSHRRVQSQSAVGAGEVYQRPPSFNTARPQSLLRPPSGLDFDLRMPLHHFQDARASLSSEAASATGSGLNFGFENYPHSSRSSESAFSNSLPVPRCASALDLRSMYRTAHYTHQRLSNSESDTGRVSFDFGGAFGFHGHSQPPFHGHSPASSVNELSPPVFAPVELPVPPVNEKFANPWAEEQGVTMREVELVYPSPITPISLGNEAFDMMARGRF
ncbi:hypothetical protein DFH06DRAFT_1358228 [Mycena polygramma]|nr:hypothetical protein DFH06DRAFT_1358228 [Mycena polygramma]